MKISTKVLEAGRDILDRTIDPSKVNPERDYVKSELNAEVPVPTIVKLALAAGIALVVYALLRK